MINLLDLPIELIEEIIFNNDFSTIRSVNKFLLEIANKVQINKGETIVIKIHNLFKNRIIYDYYWLQGNNIFANFYYYDGNKTITDLFGYESDIIINRKRLTEYLKSCIAICKEDNLVKILNKKDIILPSINIINNVIKRHPLYHNKKFRINSINNTIIYYILCIKKSKLDKDIKNRIINAYFMHIKQLL
jgi:hypothetical protein